MNDDEQILAKNIYQAMMEHSRKSPRSIQAENHRFGISDIGYCQERSRRMLDRQVPEDTDLLAAFIGTAIGDLAEDAIVAHLWPHAIKQATVTLRVAGEVHAMYELEGHPDLIVPDWGVWDGKGLALDTPIPTPTGWTTMGDVEVGDLVFDRDGDPTRVTFKSDVKNIPCWQVTLRNGRTVVCDKDHRWVVWDVKGREHIMTAPEMAKWRAKGKPLSLPPTGAAHCEDSGVPLDPWLLGYWLGNGHRNQPRVTAHLDDAEGVRREVERAGWYARITPDPRGSKAALVQVVSNGKWGKGSGRPGGNLFTKALVDLGIYSTKGGIPAEYLRADITDRIALVQGLMDSDGSWNRTRSRAVFSVTDRAMAESMAELVRSLGERVQFNSQERTGYGKTVMAWNVEWTPSTFVPFRLSRKADRVTFNRRKQRRHNIATVEPVESVPTQCIAVESESHVYLCTEEWIPTHNTDYGLATVEREGPSFQQRFQRHGYALAAWEAGFFGDMALDDVQVGNFWIDRGAQDKYVVVDTEKFDADVIDEGVRWLDEVVYAYTNGEEAMKEPPRQVCEVTCGFFRICREYDTDVRGLIDDPFLLGHIEAYTKGMELAKEGARLKDQAKAHLENISGSTGKHTLRWTWVNPSEIKGYTRKGYYKITLSELK